jgi:hypothetical protein
MWQDSATSNWFDIVRQACRRRGTKDRVAGDWTIDVTSREKAIE